MQEGTVTWAEIDLDAIASNVRSIQSFVGHAEIIAVVKANAYGHGAVPVAKAVLAAGASRLAVHRLQEGQELREAGISAPILVLGYVPPDGAEAVARLELTPTVNTVEFAHALSACAEPAGRVIPVHIKIDTGLSRYGVLPGEALELARTVTALPGLALEGLYTHFATADSPDLTFMRQQLASFQRTVAKLAANGIAPPLLHAANSASLMRLPEAQLNAVRPGIALYGMKPSDEWEPPFRLVPALTLKSLVARVRDLPTGSTVGYGRTYVAPHPIRAALVPVGYGDGYHRALSNKGSVLIHGHRAPVIGRVSMDQIVVNATDITSVAQDDEVVVIGRQGEEEISAEEVARLAGTINYEITTGLLPRVARVYKGPSA